MSQFIKVARTAQITSGQRRLVRVKGQEVALLNYEGTIYAISNTCPHSTGPLIEGQLHGTVITCPWHGAQFDITSGVCLGGPVASDVTTYAVQIKDEAIFLEVT